METVFNWYTANEFLLINYLSNLVSLLVKAQLKEVKFVYMQVNNSTNLENTFSNK